MPDHRGPKHGNLSLLIEQGLYITVMCERRQCQHRGDLDPAELIERFGDVPLESINQAAVCSACGGRQFHMQFLHRQVPFAPGYDPY